MVFICLFLPSLLALQLDMKLNNITVYNYKLVIKYFLYCLFINYFNNLFVWLLSNEKNFYYTESSFTNDFCLKYLTLAIIVSVLVPIIFKIIKDNFNLTIAVKEKKNVKKNSK